LAKDKKAGKYTENTFMKNKIKIWKINYFI